MAFMVNRKIIRGLRLGLASIGLVLAGLLAMTVARAADLDHPYYRHRRHLPPPPPVAFLPPPPSCKIVPLPEMNLYNEVTRAGIQNVCISRACTPTASGPTRRLIGGQIPIKATLSAFGSQIEVTDQ